MTRFTILSRQFGIIIFVLGFALSLIAPQVTNAAPPTTIDPSTLTVKPISPIEFPDAIVNVHVSVPHFNTGVVTAIVSFDTIMGARAIINWGPQCWDYVCDFPLAVGFDGYDAKGYIVKHSTGNQMEPANSTLTHHVFTLVGLISDSPYEFFISVDLASGPVHTFYGRFESGGQIII